jgi:hypothetical protein
MIYHEEQRNLFTVHGINYLAHCISADCALGAGIAVEFERRFQLREKLLKHDSIPECPNCILIDKVFNLITKKRYYNKPTYESLGFAIESMKQQIIKLDIQAIAMPKIGCGLDGLEWKKVRSIILDSFNHIDVAILVCYL